MREQIFANQKRLGVIPQNAKLTPWPKDLIKEWEQLTPVEKKLFIRQADVHGAYLAYTEVDGKVVSTQKQERSLPLVKPLDIAFDIGLSSASPVDDQDYKVPFNFTGKINKLTIARSAETDAGGCEETGGFQPLGGRLAVTGTLRARVKSGSIPLLLRQPMFLPIRPLPTRLQTPRR